jgi:hypothetical protein
MIEQDTIRLLRECDAGIQMGVAAIGNVLGRVESGELRGELEWCQGEHEKLQKEIRGALDRFHDAGKSPNPMAQGMSRMKTNLKLAVNGSDGAVAELMTDGCNMGVKSLSRYLNQYQAADECSKDITKRLIHLEAQLAAELRGFL